MSELTAEERRTVESYNLIAASRRQVVNDMPFNPNFWICEAQELARLTRSGNFLDIGCGDARHARSFMKGGDFRYIGVDLSRGMLAEARFHNPNANFVQMNFYNLGFNSETFHCFWAVASLFHAPKEKISTVLGEIKRVVTLGGYGFIALKEGEGERVVKGRNENDERFFAFYNLYKFWQALRANGFRVIKCSRDFREYNPPTCSNVWLLYLVQKI